MIIDRSWDLVVVNEDVIDKTLKSYQDLMKIILRPNSNTIFDKVDDYLIGRRTKLPANGSRTSTTDDRGQEDREEEEEEEEGDREELVDRIIESILRFPVQGLGVLEGRLMERPYSLMSLFSLVGHRDLIYSFVRITGIDTRDLDSNRSWFKLLSRPTQLILKSIQDHQRNHPHRNRPLSIPPDVQIRIDRIKDRIRSQDRLESERRVERDDVIESSRATKERLGLENDSDHHQGRGSRSSVRKGEWIGEYFIEDYDQDRDEERQDEEQPAVSSTTLDRPTDPIIVHPSTQSPSDRNLSYQQRKRSKLAQVLNPRILRDHPIDRENVEDRSTSSSITNHLPLPNSSNPPTFQTTTTTTESINNEPKELETPPYFIQLDHIPIDASPQSILFFLRHGPEIFKTVRTQNQRIDALGRNLNKFRLSFDHHPRTWSHQAHRGTGSLSLKSDLNRFKTINYEDLTFLPTPTTATTTTTISHEFQSILIKFDLPNHLHPSRAHPPPPSDHSRPDEVLDRSHQELLRLRQLCHSFIHHFHAQKFFKFDPLCPKLICRFSSHPSSSSSSSSLSSSHL